MAYIIPSRAIPVAHAIACINFYFHPAQQQKQPFTLCKCQSNRSHRVLKQNIEMEN